MFELYYDALDGNRYPVLDASNQPLKFSTMATWRRGRTCPLLRSLRRPTPSLKTAGLHVGVSRRHRRRKGHRAIGRSSGGKAPYRASRLGLYLLGVDASGTPSDEGDSRGLRVIRGFDATGRVYPERPMEFDPFQGGVPRKHPEWCGGTSASAEAGGVSAFGYGRLLPTGPLCGSGRSERP